MFADPSSQFQDLNSLTIHIERLVLLGNVQCFVQCCAPYTSFVCKFSSFVQFSMGPKDTYTVQITIICLFIVLGEKKH